MRTIEIDDEVYAHLQNHAVAFVETPNHTLRRLLGLPEINQPASSVGNFGTNNGNPVRSGKKNPKASLPDLTSAGLLHEGQSLYLIDYQKTRVPDCEAKIAGQRLAWNGGLALGFFLPVRLYQDKVRLTNFLPARFAGTCRCPSREPVAVRQR